MEIHHFPTEFARNLAASVDLFYTDVHGMAFDDPRLKMADRFYGALRDFQKLSLFNSFEDSLIAYHGVEITEEQKVVLTVIHESAKTWALGHVAETIMNKMEDGPKETADMARILMEQLRAKDGEVTERVKRYVVKLANLELEEKENK